MTPMVQLDSSNVTARRIFSVIPISVQFFGNLVSILEEWVVEGSATLLEPFQEAAAVLLIIFSAREVVPAGRQAVVLADRKP